MKYVDLINLGFSRFNMNCKLSKDSFGFDDFYLFLKVSKEITFEWNWQKNGIVKMVRYNNDYVQNYIEITDIVTLRKMISLYTEKTGNKGAKQQIGL